MEPPSEPNASGNDARSDVAENLDAQTPIGFGGWLVIAFGSLLAVPAVFLTTLTDGSGFIGPVVASPLIEELLKPAGLLWLLTRYPDTRLSKLSGIGAGALSGLTFASVENLIYLTAYFPNPDPTLAWWRWTVCVGLHVVCSSIVGFGMASGGAASRARDDEHYQQLRTASAHLLEAPRERSGVFQGPSLTCLVIATVIHGTYNLLAILWEFGT